MNRMTVLPTRNSEFIFCFSVVDKVYVTATSGVALASGVYHYLKYYCNAHVSWSGDQLDLPEKMPLVSGKVKKVYSDR